MAKEIVYTEPKSYFNADMRKAEREWEAKQKAAQKANSNATKKKGK